MKQPPSPTDAPAPGHVKCPTCGKHVKRKFFDNHTTTHGKKSS